MRSYQKVGSTPLSVHLSSVDVSLHRHCCDSIEESVPAVTVSTISALLPPTLPHTSLHSVGTLARSLCDCDVKEGEGEMRTRNAPHVNGNGTAAHAAPPAAPTMPQHLAAMTTYDEVERHITHIKQRITALQHTSPAPAAATADLTALTVELGLARLRLSAITANGRYLALLSCAALLVVLLVFLLCGWQSPVVHLHHFINSASRDRMARMGVTEEMMGTQQRDDQSFAAAFDWWSWLLPHDSGGNKQHT